MRMLFVLFICFAFAQGCSVKEDRDACPCRLYLDFTGLDTAVVESLSLKVMSGEELVFNDTVSAFEFGKEYMREVPRGNTRVNVWAGDEDRIEDEGIVIPFGCECPPIYMSSFLADTDGETCYEKIDVNKNHCRLTVIMEGMSVVPYSFTFRGKVDGYGLDGLPSCGDFSCVAYPDMDGESHALLPRQTDSSLMLDVDDGTAGIKTFAIGEHIESSGYDWTSKNLADMTIVLDYYLTYVKIMIQGWDKEYRYDIIL